MSSMPPGAGEDRGRTGGERPGQRADPRDPPSGYYEPGSPPLPAPDLRAPPARARPPRLHPPLQPAASSPSTQPTSSRPRQWNRSFAHSTVFPLQLTRRDLLGGVLHEYEAAA